MPTITFTSALQRHLPAPSAEVDGATVGDALAAIFATRPKLRGYVLDDQGALRKHVCIFADGERLTQEAALTRRIGPDSKLYVMQALSGG